MCSCNSNKQSEAASDSTSSANDTTNSSTSVIENTDNDSIINIRFPQGSTSVTVTGKMKGIDHPITVFIPVKQGRQLTAFLVADDSLANIRINQLYTPDGKADGPFGRELKRAINQQGLYKLIIAENLMQGDEWKGKFSLTVNVE